MAEILVRVKDKINALDFYKNCQCTKRGDVIVACPDGWNWGVDELAQDQYRILKMPDMTMDEANSFLGGEMDIDPKAPSKTLQRRAVKINLDDPSLPLEVQNYLNDDKRTQGMLIMPLTKQAVISLKVIKARVADPAVIGIETPSVIS